MANPPCMSSDGRAAVFVGTMLQTGDAVALCDECLVPWAAAILNAMTGIDPTPYLAAVSDDTPTVDAQAAGGPESSAGPNGAAATATPPPPKAGRLRSVSQGPGTGTDLDGEAPPPTADTVTPSA